jgi:hypothetical protein
MTKLLNLDDIRVDSQRTVILHGVTYAVRDFTVEEYLDFQVEFQKFGEAYNSNNIQDLRTVVQTTKRMVQLGIPDFPQEEVGKLNPLQMLTLVSMIAGFMPEPDEETQEAIEKKDEPETPVAV